MLSAKYNDFKTHVKSADKSTIAAAAVASIFVIIAIVLILMFVILPASKHELQETFEDPSGESGMTALPLITKDDTPESLYYRARILNDRQNRPREALEVAYEAAMKIPTRSLQANPLEEKLADTVIDIIEANPGIRREIPALPIVNRATAIIAGNTERDPRMQRALLESFNNNLNETHPTTAPAVTTKKPKPIVKRPRWRIDKHNVHDSSINAASAAKIAENARLAGAATAGEIAVTRQIKEFRTFLTNYAKNGSQTGPTPSNVKEKVSDEGIQLVFWRIETGSHKLPDGTKISEQQILADAWAAASASENPLPRQEALANAVIDCIISKNSTVCHSGRIARITGASDGFTDTPKMITKAMARNLIYAKCGKLTMTASDLHEKAQTYEQKEQIQQKLYADISAVIDEFADKAPSTVISNLRVECQTAAEL